CNLSSLFISYRFFSFTCRRRHPRSKRDWSSVVCSSDLSGSGKSTLLRHINALTAASSGNIEIFGRTIQNYGNIVKYARSHRSNIGFIFQQFNLVTRLSVLDNVLIGNLSRVPLWRSVCKFFTKEEKAKALSCLERVGLGELAYQRASTLSGGQQQRVAIAK